MGSKLFRDPQVLSSALATLGSLHALGSLQPRAFVSLNNLDPLSIYYLFHSKWANSISSISGMSVSLYELRATAILAVFSCSCLNLDDSLYANCLFSIEAL